MDLASIIGLFMAFVAVFFGMIWDNGVDFSAIGGFIDIPSILITFGGSLFVTFALYPMATTINALKTVKHIFSEKNYSPMELIKKIIELANVARKEGLLALEEAANQITDAFLQKGILLIVDGTDPELVRNILETEIVFIEGRHKSNIAVFDTWGSLGPAYGMIGTLIGLVKMLRQLDDPSTLGPAMAVALVTTFYGTLIANYICAPIAGKLKIRSEEEILLKSVAIEGLLSIQAGENPRIIEEKLKAFLSPKLRLEMEQKDDGRDAGIEA